MAQFPNTTAADGIWTLKKVRRAILGDNWPALVSLDEFFANTVLLLQGDTFLETMRYNIFGDASTNAHDITPVGGVHGTPFSPYNESWSVEVDASESINAAASTDFQFDADFTVEAWIYAPSSGDASVYVQNSGSNYFALNVNSGTGFNIYLNSPSPTISPTDVVPAINTWNHVALVRSGSTVSVYLNGVASSTTATNSSTLGYNLAAYVGGFGTQSAGSFDGYISNFRIVKGTAVYTSNFTPSITPLTDVSGTSLLTCNANRFIDTSSNAHTITVNGNLEIRGFSPFADTDTVTGSGYFDGSGDYLTTPSNSDFAFGTGDFTIESWIYVSATNSALAYIFHTEEAATNFAFYVDSSFQLAYWNGSSSNTLGGSFALNSWAHVAFVRSGTTVTGYINGVAVGTSTDSTNFVNTKTVAIGASGAYPNSQTFNLSNLRVVKGTAIYTSAFTPPTSPLTSVSGTSLLTLQNRGANRNIGFIDSSHPTRQITRNGNVTQGSFSPFSQDEGKWGNYFGTAGNYLDTPSSSTFSFDADFTVECWVYQTERGNNGVVAEIENYQNGVMIRLGTEGGIYDAIYVNNTLIVRPVQYIDLNTWAHIAVVRSGTTVTVYIDGVSRATATVSGTVNSTSGETRLGAPLHTTATAQPFFGYITNFRIVKGTAVYTSAFTPSTTPLTAISGTSLLTCQSNRFVDNSSNAHSITVNGGPEVTPFSPFAPSTAYNPATKGGSAYFADNAAYLQWVDSEASDDYTVEMWVYPTEALSGANRTLLNNSNYKPQIYYRNASNTWAVTPNGSAVINATSTPTPYTWTHICVTNDNSAGEVKIYINGVLEATGSGTYTYGSGTAYIGESGGDADRFYISNVRITKGVTRTGNFTPPTAPLTETANTERLLNFTNAGIYDGTGRNFLETVGDAHVENAVKKYGTGSMQFDGTGDYLESSPNSTFDLDNGNFTAEFWFNSSDISPLQTAISLIDGGGGWVIRLNASKIAFIPYISGSFQFILGDITTLSSDTWYHIAVTRDGNDFKLFINGTLEDSETNSVTLPSGKKLNVGRWNGYTDRDFNGYIDDLRITKGVARYTADFTPPAAKLEQQ